MFCYDLMHLKSFMFHEKEILSRNVTVKQTGVTYRPNLVTGTEKSTHVSASQVRTDSAPSVHRAVCKLGVYVFLDSVPQTGEHVTRKPSIKQPQVVYGDTASESVGPEVLKVQEFAITEG